MQCLETSVNDYLLQLSAWLQRNRLSLNINKTKYVIFKPINKHDCYPVNIRFEGRLLEQVTEQKFLGVWFNHNLSWNTHVIQLKSSLSRTIGCIYKVQHLIPKRLKQALYYSLVYSRMSYGILTWGTTTATNYYKLNVLQKQILRILENFKGNKQLLRTQPLFTKYNMLKADQVYYFKLLQWINKYKLHISAVPSSSSYSTRNPKRKMPQVRTNYGRQALSFQITNALNRRDMQVDFNKGVHTFKKYCRKFLVNSDIMFSLL